jgi:peptidoglycan/xylan/chitin deacetylase (PgdA/CDA1 family)
MVSAGEWEGETIQKLDRVVLWRFDDLRSTSNESLRNIYHSMIENVTSYGGYVRIAFIPGENNTGDEGTDIRVYTQEQIDGVLELLDIDRDLVNLSYHSWNHSEPYTDPWHGSLPEQSLHMNAAVDTVKYNFGFDLEGWVGPGGAANYNTTYLLEQMGISGYLIASNTQSIYDGVRYLDIYGEGENVRSTDFYGNIGDAKTNFSYSYNKSNIIMIYGHPAQYVNLDGYLENFSDFVEYVYNDHNVINMDWEEAVDYRIDLFNIDSIEKLERIRLNQYFTCKTNLNEYELTKDLDFDEDSKADMDMNVVMRGCGDFIEVQGTAEGLPFSRAQMDKALDLAKEGIEELFDVQRKALQGFKI